MATQDTCLFSLDENPTQIFTVIPFRSSSLELCPVTGRSTREGGQLSVHASFYFALDYSELSDRRSFLLETQIYIENVCIITVQRPFSQQIFVLTVQMATRKQTRFMKTMHLFAFDLHVSDGISTEKEQIYVERIDLCHFVQCLILFFVNVTSADSIIKSRSVQRVASNDSHSQRDCVVLGISEVKARVIFPSIRFVFSLQA